MKQIREWLESNGQDYAQGVALYEAHGKSSVVLRALRYGATEFTRQKLRAELQKLAETHVTRVAIASKPAKSVPAVLAKAVSKPPEPTPVSDEVHQQRRAWFAERNYLHPQLELVATDAERLAMSLRILELGDLLSASYAGEASPAVEVGTPGVADVVDAGEMRRLLANLRPQRTKLRKREDRAADLARVEADIKLLETKLKEKSDGGEPKLHEGNRNGA